MKKIIVIAGIASGLQSANAQSSVSNETPYRLFVQGKEMFDSNNYVGAENLLSEYVRTTKTSDLKMEADFMIAASAYFRGEDKSAMLLKEYLDNHPETFHRNNICFYLGSFYFEKQDWKEAAHWFEQLNIDYLSTTNQEDYAFRLAYTFLQLDQKNKARKLFEVLTLKSRKYKETSSYYLAYIDLHDRKYDDAIMVFKQLEKNPEYREQSMFFITQAQFLKNNPREAIESGNRYLANYPNAKGANASEVNRILGNSYFAQGNTAGSIDHYQRYLDVTSNPVEEDMYQLGVAYTKKGEIQKSISPLQLATTSDSKTGQAAYMLLGQNYLKLNDNRNALMAFEAASRQSFDPSISEAALYNYAMLIHKTSFSLFEESLNVLQRFLKEYPNSKYADEINKQLASTLLSTTNYQAALRIIDDMNSSNRQILQAKQSILFQLGVENYINNNFSAAMSYFDACIGMSNYDTESKNQAYYWRGEVFYRDANFRKAISSYKEFLSGAKSTNENYTDALYNLGYSYFDLKDYSNALFYFKQYINQEKNKQSMTYVDALNRAGDCNLFARDFDGASRYYALAAASGNSQSAEYADFQKSFVLGLQRDYRGKIAALDNMMTKYPSSVYYADALFEKGKSLVLLSREVEAIPVLTKLLNEKPYAKVSPQAGILLAQSYYNTNNTNGAVETYKSIAQNYRNTEEARVAVQSLEGIYRDINDINSYVNFANSLGGNMTVTASRQDSLSYLAAENVATKGNVKETAKAMREYLKAYPEGQFAGDAHFQLGLAAYDSKNYDAALKEFNSTINSGRSRDLNKALIYAASIEMDKGNASNAYKWYRKLEQTATTKDEKQTALSGVLKSAYILNNSQDVLRAANQIIDGEKSFPESRNEAYLYRAKTYLKAKDSSRAITDLSKIASDTRNVYGAEAQYLLAETYFDQKKYKQAENQVQSFIKQGTPHSYWMAKALIVLSDSYVAQNDKFAAKQYLESLKANYTGNEPEIYSMIEQRLKSIK